MWNGRTQWDQSHFEVAFLYFYSTNIVHTICLDTVNIFFNRETKGGLILESFSLWLKSPKKGAKTYLEHYPSKEMILRIVIWHPFL